MNSIFDAIFGSSGKTTMIAPEDALPGRQSPVLQTPRPHTVLGTSITGPWPEGTRVLYLVDWTPQLAAMSGIGVGIDYALLILNRFRLERGLGV